MTETQTEVSPDLPIKEKNDGASQLTKQRELTPRQMAAVRMRAAGATFREIAEAGHYSTREAAFGAFAKPFMQQALDECLNEAFKASDLTPEMIIKGLHEIAIDPKASTAGRVNAWKLMGQTDAAGNIFSERLKIEKTGTEGSIELVVEVLGAFVEFLGVRDPKSLKQDDLRLFAYLHFGMKPPKSLISHEM